MNKYIVAWALSVRIAQIAVAFVRPAICSLRALESKHTLDDSQWLTYWFVAALLATAEATLWPVLRYVPLYEELKLAFLSWLSLNAGASILYFQARPTVLKVLSFVNKKQEEIETANPDLAGSGDEKEGEMSAIRLKVADVQDDVSACLRNDLDKLKSGDMSLEDLEKKLEQVKKALTISGFMPISVPTAAGNQHVDLAVIASAGPDTKQNDPINGQDAGGKQPAVDFEQDAAKAAVKKAIDKVADDTNTADAALVNPQNTVQGL